MYTEEYTFGNLKHVCLSIVIADKVDVIEATCHDCAFKG